MGNGKSRKCAFCKKEEELTYQLCKSCLDKFLQSDLSVVNSRIQQFLLADKAEEQRRF